MPIFRAIGFGVLIITLRLLMPAVLEEGEQTAIAFLRGAHVSADAATSIAASAAVPFAPASGTQSMITTRIPYRATLPQAPQIYIQP
jgi:hypothetical protein